MRSRSYLRVDWQLNRLWKGFVSRINCSLGWGVQMRGSERVCFLSLMWASPSPRKSGGAK